MAQYYKLNDAVKESVSLNLPYMKDGVKVYKFYTLRPGKKYDDHIDDEVFLDALRGAHKRVTYTPEKEAALRESGAKYEVVVCKVCGGKAKKIDLWLVEVV